MLSRSLLVLSIYGLCNLSLAAHPHFTLLPQPSHEGDRAHPHFRVDDDDVAQEAYRRAHPHFTWEVPVGLSNSSTYNYTYGSYDEDVAKDALVYTSASYCPSYKVQNWSMNSKCAERTTGFQLGGVFDVDPDDDELTASTFAFAYTGIDTEREWVIGAFKGTNQTDDFIADLEGGEFTFKTCTIGGNDFGYAHSGFCSYYHDLHKAGFMDSIVALAEANPTYKVIFTGHSLGAAAAVLASLDYYFESGSKGTVYTYGQPRVGDHSFSKKVQKKTEEMYRVVHKADIIAHLPICCAVFGECKTLQACPYHNEVELWYDNNMRTSEWTECDGGEDNSCGPWVYSVSDHMTYFNHEVGEYCCY